MLMVDDFFSINLHGLGKLNLLPTPFTCCINQNLLYTSANEKTAAIQHWIRSVIDRMEHYKNEHNQLLKEDMTLLELALWKAKLDKKDEDNFNLKMPAKKAKVDMGRSTRKVRRITSGAVT